MRFFGKSLVDLAFRRHDLNCCSLLFLLTITRRVTKKGQENNTARSTFQQQLSTSLRDPTIITMNGIYVEYVAPVVEEIERVKSKPEVWNP